MLIRRLAILSILVSIVPDVVPGIGHDSVARAEKPLRFTALMTDGTRRNGNALSDGHVSTPSLKLDGQPLLEPANSARWIKDRGLAPAPWPQAFVETFTGDCLPGVVTGYRDGNELAYEPLPAHFLVRSDLTLAPPNPAGDMPLRIAARFVKRIVWQRRERDLCQPSTVFLRDGRELAYRAIRMGDGVVQLLVADGQRKLYFNEIAELHFPAHEPWEPYLDELAVLAPDGATRLLQIETTQRLIATTSWERVTSRGEGGPQSFHQWVVGVQPAWSLDVLWVSSSTIWMRRYFAPHEVPLSRRPYAKIVEKSALGGTGHWPQVNRNVQAGQLRSGGQEFSWGFGVHAHSELYFDLPVFATSLKAQVGIDRISGRGGCVRARVFADSKADLPLFESPLLIGSESIVSTGDLPVSEIASEKGRIVLQIDASHDQRPPGADPFEIRDMADWLDPTLKLDEVALSRAVRERVARQVPNWNGWQLSSETLASNPGPSSCEWSNQWDEAAQPFGSFRLASSAKMQAAVFEREIAIADQDHWLVLSAFHVTPPTEAARIEVRFDGEPVAEYSVPLRNRSQPDPRPMLVPLRAFQNRKVVLQIVQRPAATPVVWRSLRTVTQLPMLYQAFEDAGSFLPDAKATDTAHVTTDQAKSGSASVSIPAGGSFQLAFPRPIPIRERPEWGEYRFLTFAVRRAGAGRFALEFNTRDGREIAARYDGGKGEPAWGDSKRIYHNDLPDHWEELPRDLFADFGPLDITGITFTSLDDGPTRFDKIYLARAQNDFELITSPHQVSPGAQQAQLNMLPAMLHRVLPATVLVQSENAMASTGAIITADGDVLTIGHAMPGPNQPVSLTMPDGRVLRGLTRGVDRNRDLGLIKIMEPGNWPTIDMPAAPQIQQPLFCATIGYRKSASGGEPPWMSESDIMRTVNETLAAQFDGPDMLPGALLVDQHHRVLGLCSRRSSFSGQLYSRILDPNTVMPRLRAGEIWGRWPLGAQPRWGGRVETADQGCRVTQIDLDGPAAKAGMVVGDRITRVHDQTLHHPRQLDELLRDHDAHSVLEVHVLRQNIPLQFKLSLAPGSM